MVTNKPKNNALEKLDIGQVASLCCVSRDRVNIWLEAADKGRQTYLLP